MLTLTKTAKWAGIVLGVLILWYICFSLTCSRQLRNVLRELKDQGVPLTAAEIAPPPVPDAENAALVVSNAMAMIPQRIFSEKSPPSALKSLLLLIETNMVTGKVGTDVTGWTDAQREEGAKLIQSDEVRELYALLEKAVRLPHYNNNLQYSQGMNMKLPNSSAYRAICRIMAVKAGFDMQSGNLDSALDTIRTGLKITNKMKDEPVLITQLARIACDLQFIEALERMADAGELPADQIKALLAELALHPDRMPWVNAMNGERIGGIQLFDKLAHTSGEELTRAFSDYLDIRSVPDWVARWGLPVVRPIINKDCVVYLTAWAKVQRYYELPYYQIADSLKWEPLEKQIPRYAVITRLLILQLESICIRIAAYDATVEICRVGLALKLFKQKTGAYPETLDKLAPEFLDSIPVDPFTGKALVYRKVDDGFLLYSLGQNRRNDGGKPQDKSSKAWPPPNDYDIIWKCGR